MLSEFVFGMIIALAINGVLTVACIYYADRNPLAAIFQRHNELVRMKARRDSARRRSVEFPIDKPQDINYMPKA